MSLLSNTPRFRRTIAGWSMVGAPLFGLAALALATGFTDDDRGKLAEIYSHHQRAGLSLALGVVALALLFFAIFGVMHLLRDRASLAGNLGGGLATVGLLAVLAFPYRELAIFQAAEGPAIDREAMVRLLGRLADTHTYLPIFILSLVFSVGLIVLALGLFQAAAAPPLSAAALGAFAVIFPLAFVVTSKALGLAAFGVLLVALGPLGLAVLRQGDDEWQVGAAPGGGEPPRLT